MRLIGNGLTSRTEFAGNEISTAYCLWMPAPAITFIPPDTLDVGVAEYFEEGLLFLLSGPQSIF
jgi:hypothetical protein